MEARIRVTVEVTVLDDDTLERIKKDIKSLEDNLNESGEVKDAKVKFEVL